MSSDVPTPTAAPTAPEPDPRRWRALGVLGLIQFMLVLDLTVVSVALPRIQHELDFSVNGLAWVVNGYVVMNAGLLLLGGRLSDYVGRRRLFMTGVVVFGVASIVCGVAQDPATLVTARFVQGVGAALATPSALGLIAVLFPDMRERFKAFGIWGGIAGLAGTLGPIIGGLLVDFASWRWIFFLNVPIVLAALVMAPRIVPAGAPTARQTGRIDYVGAVTTTGGLVAIVYGLLQASAHPWGSGQVLVPLLIGVALLIVMLIVESRTASPLIPLTFFTDRTRTTANVVTVLLAAVFFTLSFLLSLYGQEVLLYSPLTSGLAGLPFAATITGGIYLSTKLLPKLGVKPILAIAFFGSAVGMVMLGTVSPGTRYFSGLMPAMLVLGLFYGASFPAATNGAMHNVDFRNAGLASGVQNTMNQVGGALGLATLITLALRYGGTKSASGVPERVAATDGYVLAFRVGAGLLVLAGLLVVTLMKNIRPRPRTGPPPGTPGGPPAVGAANPPAQKAAPAV